MVKDVIQRFKHKRIQFLMGSLLIILLPIVGYAQKVEMEERIPESQFPEQALQQIQKEFPDRRRVKFYRELSVADSLTFEAKLLSGRHWYSVEFFPDGTLLDIEKKIKFNTLPDITQQAINQYWQKEFKKYRVVKCQEQRSKKGIRYEIEIRGKDENGTNFYQYLFGANGTFIRQEKIELRPSDMMLY